MRAVGAARWFLFSTSIMALAAIFAPERAYATCTYDVPGTGIIALSGDMCSAAGPYSGVPPGYVAFSASGGGVITSTGGVTINNTPTPVANAFGVYANGGQINLTAGIADVQPGATAYDFYARDGGAITFADGKIESTGAGASGLYASGAGRDHGHRGPDHRDGPPGRGRRRRRSRYGRRRQSHERRAHNDLRGRLRWFVR